MQIVGSIVNANHWLLDTSLFQHMAAAPAVAPDWTAAAIMTALGVVTGAIGVKTYSLTLLLNCVGNEYRRFLPKFANGFFRCFLPFTS